MRPVRIPSRALPVLVTAFVSLLVSPTSAYAFGEDDDHPPRETPAGDASGDTLTAEATATRIKVTQVNGGASGESPQTLAPVDPNWKPPACWYEPVATPQELKTGVERLKKGQGEAVTIPVTPSLGWGPDLMVNNYEKGKEQTDGVKSYKNFNLGKDGKFWRGVVNEERRYDPEAYSCDKLMFWQAAGALPKIEHAPTPDVLAAYAYAQVHVPDTKVELRPEARSTVNLPTWVWLDKGTFKAVKVRAELPGTGVWAETTAKPISLHLDPGTKDATTFPAGGECTVNKDGGIGAPYSKGNAEKSPPCGVTYLRATGDHPNELKASVTWEITWEGSGGAGDDLPDGTFGGTQDVIVQEIQSINR